MTIRVADTFSMRELFGHLVNILETTGPNWEQKFSKTIIQFLAIAELDGWFPFCPQQLDLYLITTVICDFDERVLINVDPVVGMEDLLPAHKCFDYICPSIIWSPKYLIAKIFISSSLRFEKLVFTWHMEHRNMEQTWSKSLKKRATIFIFLFVLTSTLRRFCDLELPSKRILVLLIFIA